MRNSVNFQLQAFRLVMILPRVEVYIIEYRK